MAKAFIELCYACRTGDVENADRLISTGINLNDVDEFDNSPLFLASLCGHEELVKLLLERGAICDRDRYEGARCIYGALTDSIRDILLAYDISKAVDISQPFATHISNLFRDKRLGTDDISFNFGNEMTLSGHKFILKARLPLLLKEAHIQQNESNIIHIQDNIPREIFEIFLQFIYLIPVLHKIKSTDYGILLNLSDEFNTPLLYDFLHKSRHMVDPAEKSTLMADYQYRVTEFARKELRTFVSNNIIANVLEWPTSTYYDSTSILKLQTCSAYPDLLISSVNCSGVRRTYPCHLAVLIRCDYFKIMFSNPFSEKKYYSAEKRENKAEMLPLLSLPCHNFEELEILIKYVYYDNADISWEYAIDVIKLASFVLSDRLKTMAAAVITQSKEILESISIFEILSLAWEADIEKLEHFSAKHLAYNLDDYIDTQEFEDAILKSSQRIKSREETDTIELIADMRYYLLEKYGVDMDDLIILEKNNADEKFLKSIGLFDFSQDMQSINAILQRLSLRV
ncbi:hypothetical protein KAFR_0K01160 [Kazachstania africana CBS 2517]|uniref:BTB domain-containing protein n=1 Tax=Kazachstania africana (strain ATCC 22294 / BCRC 22015 / CBS 2517 / CECT 1963 / NBRC 1671 / NRRL Y-8276) TaxID=1071382 RepID=H2B1H1_KAZAF|nr:hypothetical protein KAFR_0K01160 [Kazachstania africana CBS 2517]CCF60471.1 hypothetical protein KAFR_0K01160 [Kazachstania africana CBS 2517]